MEQLKELKEMFLDNHIIKTAPFDYWYYHTENYPNPVFLFDPKSVKNFNKSYGPTLSDYTYSSKEWGQIIKKEEKLHKENQSEEALYINNLIKDYMSRCSINENKIENKLLYDLFREKAGSVRFSIISLRKSGVFDPRHILALGMEKVYCDTCYLKGIPFVEDPNIKDDCEKRIPVIQKEFDSSLPLIVDEVSAIIEKVSQKTENDNIVLKTIKNATNEKELEMSDIFINILECKNEKGLRYRLISKKHKIKSTRYSLDTLTKTLGLNVINDREEARAFVKNAINTKILIIDNEGNVVITVSKNETVEEINNKTNDENMEILMTDDFKNTILAVYSLANEGKTISDIIECLNLDMNTICKAFRYSPVTFKSVENQLDNDTIIELFNASKALELNSKGMNTQAIASELSITYETVKNYLDKKNEVFSFLHPSSFGLGFEIKEENEIKEELIKTAKKDIAVKTEDNLAFIKESEDKIAEVIAQEKNKDNKEALFQDDLNAQAAIETKGATVLLTNEPISQAPACPNIKAINNKEYQEAEKKFIVKKIKGNPIVLNSDGSPMSIDDIIFLKYASNKIIDSKKKELVVGRLSKRLYEEIDLSTNEGCFIFGSVILKGIDIYEKNPKMQVVDIVAKVVQDYLQK